MIKHPDSAILDRIGTTTQVAALLEIRPQAVSQWRRRGIPSARRQTLRLMRPELFQASTTGQDRADGA